MSDRQAADFFNDMSEVEHYNKTYGGVDFSTTYPANLKRLEIFLSIIGQIKPKKIIDAGCGNGMPIVAMLKKGYFASGYDKSENMLVQAKKNIEEHGFSAELVCEGDFEDPMHVDRESVDCITGMGTFYYSKNIEQTLINQVSKLKPEGSIIFSLRNRLFDLTTVNPLSTSGFVVYSFRLLEGFNKLNASDEIILLVTENNKIFIEKKLPEFKTVILLMYEVIIALYM